MHAEDCFVWRDNWMIFFLDDFFYFVVRFIQITDWDHVMVGTNWGGIQKCFHLISHCLFFLESIDRHL